MEPDLARAIAMACHHGQRNRFGDLVTEHLSRVAAAVPADAQATAWLHDALESTGADPADLSRQGLTAVELAALELLTRTPEELYDLYALRIAYAPGEEGRLARTVKLADLDDHLTHHQPPDGAPPYAWARRHISSAQYLRHELGEASAPGAA
jgi:hypothetical protein